MFITLDQTLLIDVDHDVTRGPVDQRVLRRGPFALCCFRAALWLIGTIVHVIYLRILVISRRPGFSIGVPINSTPANSSASLMAKSVRTWPDVTPCMTASLLIVAVPTPQATDRSAELQGSNAQAARICPLVINAKVFMMIQIGLFK
jgi:hypothetical protein